MIEYVIKRNGDKEPFNQDKIKYAINKAYNECRHTDAPESILDRVLNLVDSVKTEDISIETIQDFVEFSLSKENCYDVAKCYSEYRARHALLREVNRDNTFKGIINAEQNNITRDNANMNADTPAGMMMKFASETTKPYVNSELLSKKVRKYVENNILYIHDKDYYPTKSLTCLQHPLDKILSNGFICGHGEARPAKRIETAAALTEVSLQAIQNEMHGGQSIPALDFYLAPYVRMTYKEELHKLEELLSLNYESLYDAEIDDYIFKEIEYNAVINKKTVKQFAINQTVKRVHQAMESFIHNCNNIHSRGGEPLIAPR